MKTLMVLLVFLLGGPAFADGVPPLDKDLAVKAHGGATIKTPDWKTVREDEDVAILEQAPTKKSPFYVLMVAIEVGPKASAVKWDKIRDNIIEAASKDGRKLELALGEPFEEAEGFTAHTFTGNYKSKEGKAIGLQLVVLLKDRKMVTISVVTKEPGEDSEKLLGAIARTTTLGPG